MSPLSKRGSGRGPLSSLRSDFAFLGSRLERGYSISAASMLGKGLKELTLGRDLRYAFNHFFLNANGIA